MSYIPLHVHTHYSLLLGLSKPIDIVHQCHKLGINTCAITDENTISGTIAFYKTMTANNIKPILGVKLSISNNLEKNNTDDKLPKITLLAKNLKGWQELIKIVSLSNNEHNFHKTPRASLAQIKEILDESNLICITGYYNSILWNNITSDNELTHDCDTKYIDTLRELEDIFGKTNIFVELHYLNNYYNQHNISKYLKQQSAKYNIQTIAGIESYYCNQLDASDQRILLCSKLKTTIPEVSKKIINKLDTGYNHFFISDDFYIPDEETIYKLYDQEDIDNTFKIGDMCESYSPLNKPVLPTFNYPKEYKTDSEYLRQLCRDGWRTKIMNQIPKDKQSIYVDRIKYELSILEEAKLSSYFLIVRDIVQYVKKNKLLAGPGRGSAAGCLVSYLIDITNIDPIKYNLLFERFYNAGRNTKDRISMPDIDVDVPINFRDTIISYIKETYGENKVSQMITFNTLKGRGALKEVLRVYNNITFEEMNQITKNIPDESKIADELQEIKDEEGSASIIRWSLENYPNKFKDWCSIDQDGSLVGPLAKRFEQAIRIEGTKCHQSKHAAGIAISAQPLSNLCPVIFDQKTGQNIAGLEMNDLDSLGIIKFDILGIALLDKIMYINELTEERS